MRIGSPPMTRSAIALPCLALAGLLAAAAAGPRLRAEGSPPMADVRFVTLDPGHFHAALVQKEMYPGVSKVVHVYAPLGPDLIDHLARVSRFNQRADNPTSWELQVHATPDFLPQMLRDRAVNALVDKPWILEAADLPKLERALDTAEARKLVALDIMTERHEITSELQRE